MSAGLTQTELAGERFSKEYVSQIERGKTKPTAATIEWLARRLGVDMGFLATGVASDDRARVEAVLARAEALTEAHRFDEAATEFRGVPERRRQRPARRVRGSVLSAEAWARWELGEVKRALVLRERGRDDQRGRLLLRPESCRGALPARRLPLQAFEHRHIPRASSARQLQLAERSGLPCDLLRSEILNWRSRCYRRQRDFEAAREDVERALELAESLGDRATMANVYVQASLVAERSGHWLLARTYAERAKSYYEELNDERNVAGLLNNLGGLNLMLGKPEEAIEYLKRSYTVLLDKGERRRPRPPAGVSSLAHVHLMTGQVESAEKEARHALELLEGREDFLLDIAPTQLVLGRSLLEQGRLDEAQEMLRLAEASAEQIESISHRAAAWMAQGDLAARQGEPRPPRPPRP